MTMEEAKEKILYARLALEEVMGPARAQMAPKWRGGKLVLLPANTAQQSKDIEIDVFFHKIVMVREALRVLEQRINNHEKLDDADRVQLQQYLTRIYGTLTTFNVLFAEEDDRFVGQGK